MATRKASKPSVDVSFLSVAKMDAPSPKGKTKAAPKVTTKVAEQAEPEPMKFSMVEALDEYLYSLNMDNEKNQEMYGGDIEVGIHPSGVHGNVCSRNMYYQITGDYDTKKVNTKEDYIGATLRRIFDNGSYTHERLQRYFADMGGLLGSWRCKTCHTIYGAQDLDQDMYKRRGYKVATVSQIPTLAPTKCECGSTVFKYLEWRARWKDMYITGKCDGIFDMTAVKGPKEIVMLEFKSINSFGFQKLSYAQPAHITQMQFYMRTFVRHYGMNIRHAVIIYEDKNNQQMKEYWIPYDPQEIAEWDTLEQAVKSVGAKKLPKAVRLPMCKDCLYRNVCW